MFKFKAGNTYTGRYICDSDSIHRMTVAKRTEKTLTTSEGKRLKIHTDDRDGGEFVYPHGRYSMALIVRAERDADQSDESKPVLSEAELEFISEVWMIVASERVTVMQSPHSGNLETRDASEAACVALQARFPAGRIYHTVHLGWRFVVALEAAK